MMSLVAGLYRLRLVLSGALIVGAAFLAPRANVTHVDNDLKAWFSENDPLYRDYERFRKEFGGTQPLIIAFKVGDSSGGDIFTRERLAFLQQITAEIERVPSVARIQSLATATILRPASREAANPDDTLELKPLLDLSRRSAGEIRTLATGDDLLRGELVSEDGTVAAVVVTFDEDRLNQARGETLDRIYTAVRKSLPYGLHAFYNGSIEIDETYNRVTVENQRRFVPPILLLTVVAVYVLFRSVSRALIVLFSIAVSVLWTLGIYSLMGFGFNILTAMLTPLVVVLAISDDVHLIQHYDHERQHLDAEQAFKRTVSYLFTPLLGASGTTALGLLSLATSDVIAIRQFGIGAAVGVMVDVFASLVLVPTLLSYVPPSSPVAGRETYLGPWLSGVAGYAIRRPAMVLAATVAAVAVAIAGMTQLRVDTNHIGFFSRSHPLSQSAAVIDDSLAGVYSFHVLLEGPPDALKMPDAITRIDRLSADFRALPGVRKTASMADYVKRANEALHPGDPDAGVIPNDPSVVAQELFLIALNDEGRRELERLVSSDFSTAQILARLPSMSSGKVYEMIETAQRMATARFEGTPIRATATGSGRLFSALDHYVVSSQISSFGTAFVTIMAAMFLIFRSYKYGLIALVPNVLPVIGVLGLMGWLGISINIATVMVASVALGVVDDDTVHFLHRFRHEIAGGLGADAAAHVAATVEGRAAFTTAVVNICGFAVLFLSEYKPSAWFGGLLAATLGMAFVAEVLVLPATLVLVRRWVVPQSTGLASN